MTEVETKESSYELTYLEYLMVALMASIRLFLEVIFMPFTSSYRFLKIRYDKKRNDIMIEKAMRDYD